MCKLTRPQVPQKGNKLTDTKRAERTKKPVVGITNIGCTSKYSLKAMAKPPKRLADFAELERFIEEFKECESLEVAISRYISYNKGKNTDKESRQLVKRLGYQNEMIHLHAQRGGKGRFVIHGVYFDNIFEILMLDPNHDFYG